MADALLRMIPRAALATTVRQLRARAPIIVCTNGVFDLMHIGHLRYLKAARSMGDALIVGINSDASTRRLKGPSRPIVPELERAEMVAGLACVDLVTIFEEDTAETLLQIVRPDIYVKGGDYALTSATDATITGKPLPEAATVLTMGGRIELVAYLPSHSTTELIARIKDAT